MMKYKMFKEPTNRRDQDEIRVTAIILLIAATVSVATISVCMPLYGEPLEKDSPPLNASSLEDVDISISPDEVLPINGTVTMDTTGITDYDINDLVPAGVTVVIQNDSVTMTNKEVTIASAGIPIESEEDED